MGLRRVSFTVEWTLDFLLIFYLFLSAPGLLCYKFRLLCRTRSISLNYPQSLCIYFLLLNFRHFDLWVYPFDPTVKKKVQVQNNKELLNWGSSVRRSSVLYTEQYYSSLSWLRSFYQLNLFTRTSKSIRVTQEVGHCPWPEQSNVVKKR